MATKPSDGVGGRAAASRGGTGSAPRVGEGRGLDAKSLEAIGRNLKAHYEDLVRAPVPGKFLDMLDRLEATERSKPQGGSNESG
jgi:Anti-sigma factor NepR